MSEVKVEIGNDSDADNAKKLLMQSFFYDAHYGRGALLSKDQPRALTLKIAHKVILSAYMVDFLKIAFIQSLYVFDGQRGNGFGRLIINDFCDRAQKEGFLSVTVETMEFQSPGFYSKCGFKKIFTQETKLGKKYTFEKKLKKSKVSEIMNFFGLHHD